jgi:hypothetical protein
VIAELVVTCIRISSFEGWFGFHAWYGFVTCAA